jgi:hypothetical protein
MIDSYRYREPSESYDEDSAGNQVTYPESFVICLICGVSVYDTEAHDRHHALLNRLTNK